VGQRLEGVANDFIGALERRRASAFVLAVYRKSQADRSGSLAALITYYALLSVFPILLLSFTLLNLVLRDDPGLRRDIVDNTLAQFPVVGDELGRTIKPLPGSGLGLALALLLLAWGALGVTTAAQQAMGDVWDVPASDRPGLAQRTARGVAFLAGLGVSIVVATYLASWFAVGEGPLAFRVVGLAASVAVNIALYAFAFHVLTPVERRVSDLLAGAVVGAVAWSALQAVGGYLVARQLRHSSALYGFFAVVLGLAAWLYLGARVSVIAAEVNVVRFRRRQSGYTEGSSDDVDSRRAKCAV
jgi:YihY family inner membrane protein